jgi:hypothetical protein
MNDNIKESKNINILNELKNKLEHASRLINKDYRESKKLLIELKQLLKNADISKNEKIDFQNKIQERFNEIQKIIAKEQIDFENEAANNYFILKQEIASAIESVNKSENHRETWDYLVEVQNHFKGIKLRKEHREQLYGQLQQAFELLKQKIENERNNIENETKHIFENYVEKIKNLISKITDNQDINEIREELISTQSEVKKITFSRNRKDEIQKLIQEAFDLISLSKLEKEKSKLEISNKNFDDLNKIADEILAETTANVEKSLKDKIIQIQNQVRNSELVREQRSLLLDKLQKAYEVVNHKLNSEREQFVKEASENYKRLKSLVEKGLKQANESHEYKATREFLKKIQSEFKGIKMIKEEREVLYSQLQQAFEILNNRVDDYFRNKKKNWAIQMQYKIAEIDAEIHHLKQSIDSDYEKLQELEEHRDILLNSDKKTTLLTGIQARIDVLKRELQSKKEKIIENEENRKELLRKIGEEQNDNIEN